MKRLYFFVAVFFCSLASWAQINPATNPDAFVKRLMERHTHAPSDCTNCDATGIMLVQVSKSGDRLKTNILFNSFTQKDVLTEASLNHPEDLEKIKAMPEGFQVTVPLFVYLANDNGTYVEPDAATKQRYEQVVASAKEKGKVTSPVTIIGYKPAAKTGTGK